MKSESKYRALLKAAKQFVRYADSGKHPKWATYMKTAAGAKLRAATN